MVGKGRIIIHGLPLKDRAQRLARTILPRRGAVGAMRLGPPKGASLVSDGTVYVCGSHMQVSGLVIYLSSCGSDLI